MEERARLIIAEVLDVDPETIEASTGADNCEKWDSLAQVVIISRIADELGVDIPFDAMMDVRCAGDLFSLVRE